MRSIQTSKLLFFAVFLAAVLPAASMAQTVIAYPPTAATVANTDPALARPVAVGPAAAGGGIVGIRVSTTQFALPMDMYFGILASHISPEIFLLGPAGNLLPLSQGALAWKTGVTSANESVLANIPASALPAGTYNLFLLVTEAGSLAGPILWQTSFVISTPVAPQADTYFWIGNTPFAVPAALGVLANDPAGSTVVPADLNTALGGTVTINADGSFTYVPPFNQIGADSFTYTATGAAGATQVNIQMNSRAWYVNNTVAAGGTGAFGTPFNTLLSAQAASLPGDTIFVFSGAGTTGQDGGITLKQDQELIGQGVAFAFAGFTIAPASAPPQITDLGVNPNGGIVVLASNTEVAGLRIQGDPAVLAGRPGIFGNAVNGFSIHDNEISGTNREGIVVANSSGTGVIAGNTISGTSQNRGIDFDTNAVTPVSLIIVGNTISNTADDGIRVLFNTGALGGVANISLNNVTTVGVVSAASRGIDLEVTDLAVVTSTVSGNTVSGAQRAGILIRTTGTGLQAARHRSFIEGNTVSSAGGVAAGEGAIDVEASLDARMDARFASNTVTATAAGARSFDFQADGTSAAMCLGFTGNSGDAALELNNANTPGTVIQVEGPTRLAFEAGNPGIAGGFIYQPVENAISFQPVGFCGLP